MTGVECKERVSPIQGLLVAKGLEEVVREQLRQLLRQQEAPLSV